MKIIGFGIGVFLLMFIGGVMTTYLLSGIITLAGIVFMIESIPWLKWVAIKLRNVIDIVLFGVAIYGAFTMSVTMAMAFGIAGLGYTLLYKPYLHPDNSQKVDKVTGRKVDRNGRVIRKYESLR